MNLTAMDDNFCSLFIRKGFLSLAVCFSKLIKKSLSFFLASFSTFNDCYFFFLLVFSQINLTAMDNFCSLFIGKGFLSLAVCFSKLIKKSLFLIFALASFSIFYNCYFFFCQFIKFVHHFIYLLSPSSSVLNFIS